MASLKFCFPVSDADESYVKTIKIASEFAEISLVEGSFTGTVSIPGRYPILCLPKENIAGPEAVLKTLARLRPDVGLYGLTFTDYSLVDQWIDYLHDELDIPLKRILSSQPHSDDEGKVKAALAVVDNHLCTNTFMVCNCITIVDINLVVGLCQINDAQRKEYTKSLINLNRLLDTCTNQKQFSNHVALKPLKKVNPLDLLPASPMNLEEWKRCYSNTKDLLNTAMSWFWKNFDKKGYSLWLMKYDKSEDECKVAFLTSNLLGGFLQRMDQAFRKYSFAVNNILEEKGCSEDKKSYDIMGVWLVRGPKIPQELLDHPSYEYHTFTELDSENPEHRKMVEDYWCSDEIIEGRKIADCKVWK